MNKEALKSAFFEKDFASENISISEAMVEALDCEPIRIENDEVRRDFERVTDLLRKYSESGWKKAPEATLQDKALVEYFPLVLLERIVFTASDNLKAGRNGRSTRMYRFVSDKLGLAEDPREIAGLFEKKIDEVLDIFENKQVDVGEVTSRARAINGALFPASQE